MKEFRLEIKKKKSACIRETSQTIGNGKEGKKSQTWILFHQTRELNIARFELFSILMN